MSTNLPIEPSRQMITYERPVSQQIVLSPEDGVSGSEGLATYWYVLSKRRWTVLGVAISLAAIVAIVSLMMTPIYRATARLEIEAETPPLQSATDVYQKADADDPFIQTQIQVLKSYSVAWETIKKLHLEPTLGVLRPEELNNEAIEKHKLDFIKAFEKNLTIELLPKTRILSVGYDSPDPKAAALVATTVAAVYLDYNFRGKYDAIRRSGWMEQQLAELKEKTEKSQQALVDYEQQHQITNTGDKQNVLSQMLGDLSHDLTLAQSDRIQKESQFLQAQTNHSELASLVQDDLLQKLEARAADLNEQYTATIGQYGPSFPKATRLQSQIAEVETQIVREQNRIIDRIHKDYDTARNRETLASRAVETQKKDVARLNQLLVQDNILRHEFDTNQQLYQSLMQRLKDATVSAGLRSTSIHLVDDALPPSLPVRPEKTLYTACALFAGLALGVMGAFAQDRMDSSIRTAEEAEALAVTPALGVIPFDRTRFRMRPKLKKRESCPIALTLTKRPNSSLAEAFRALGTAVSVPANPPKTLLVTSSQNGEGKTVTALNLAQTLAHRRGLVVIVDCDLRKSGIAEALNLANDKGVSTVLSGEHGLAEALQRYTPHPNLWVLPSGPAPVNPAELLASARMIALLGQLSERFTTVIIDSPPVLAVTDSTILSALVDRVLLVAASGSTSRAGLVRTRRILTNAGARILGVAVNKLDPRHQGYREYSYTYSSNSNDAPQSLRAS